MRTIKFRVWDKANNIFMNSPFVGGHQLFMLNNKFELGYVQDSFDGQPDYVYIFQQFTGLKDHKNVECCEGDIVRYFNLPTFEISYGLLGEVQFINGCFCIKCRDKSKGGNVSWITEFDELDYFEVVGNVMETPELLK